MRSSKSRSRSKTNRPRTLGNIINRVFDSSGPEGKVRGTPQQIIEKYQMLARDAQLSNDRVAAENFSQHAEHYTRLLAEAMREMAAEQETRNTQQGGQNGWQNRSEPRNDARSENRGDSGAVLGDGEQPDIAAMDVVDLSQNSDLGAEQPQAEPRNYQQRPQRQNDNRAQNNRANGQQRDAQPREDRANNQPREDRANSQPREFQTREERKPKPAVAELRFETGVQPSDPQLSNPQLSNPQSSDPRPMPVAAPIFESPAALVAQLESAPAPKPRAPRAKRDVVPKDQSTVAPDASLRE